MDHITYRSFGVRVRAINEQERCVDVVASTAALDSYDEIVDQTWDLKRYNANPVVLYNHNREGFLETLDPEDTLPIGYGRDVGVKNGQLEVTLCFVTAAANPMAELVWQGFKQGSLHAVSVGFNPKNVTSEKIDDKTVYRLSDNELYEISVTPMGANPEAVSKARRKSVERLHRRADRGAVPYSGYEPVDSGSWDGEAAVGRIRKWASSDGSGDGDTIDWGKYKNGFAWFDGESAETFGAYKLPHHDVRDGKLVTVRSGVIAAGDAAAGSRGGVNIPDSDMGAVKSHLEKHYHQFDLNAPWEEKTAVPGTEKTTMTLEEKIAALEAEKAQLTAAIAQAKKDAETPTAELRVANERIKSLTTERDELSTKLLSGSAELKTVQAQLIEKEVDALVGVKIDPAQKSAFLELAQVDITRFRAIVGVLPEKSSLKTVVTSDPKATDNSAATPDLNGDDLAAAISAQAGAL